MAREHAEEIRRLITNPERVCRALGLIEGAKRQTGGLLVRCPSHGERNASCSVTLGEDGTIRALCFSCGFGGDIFCLVAARTGLDHRRQFRDVLLAAAETFGLDTIAAELRGDAPPSERPMPPQPEPEPERNYPPQGEVEAVWNAAVPVERDERSCAALARRGLRPGPELARALHDAMRLPCWARYQGRTWTESGHRIVLPVFDHVGAMRSLRAWQVNAEANGPKRLPPAGRKAAGLILANDGALRWLRGSDNGPLRLLVLEGEPDWSSACQTYPAMAIIGIGSGSWSKDFADRVPLGSLVAIATHNDEAGTRYSNEMAKTLAERAIIRRIAL